MSTQTKTLTELADTMYMKDTFSITLNTQFLNHNFEIVKQCLLKIQDLENSIGKNQQNGKNFSNKLQQIEDKLNKNLTTTDKNKDRIQKIENNVGDQFMKKMYEIEEKTKNMFAFEETVQKLQKLNKFVNVKDFNDYEQKIAEQLQNANKIKEQFDRYVPKADFNTYKAEQVRQFEETDKKIDTLGNEIIRLDKEIIDIRSMITQTRDAASENNQMLKQINFPAMLEKNKKFKEDVENRMNELSLKMKKKVGTSELSLLEKAIVEKLDKFLLDNEKSRADKGQTKEALQFLEKKINDTQEVITQKLTEDDGDALFAVKKWQCASCTKDMGKYEGKLGQYKPWGVFPCKELDPEKTGGFGYLNYIDKMAYKKGTSVDDQQFERMNKTFNEGSKQRQNSPKRNMNTTRASNVISNYGAQQKNTSLKEMYFRELKTEKGQRTSSNNKFFRVKKDMARNVSELEKEKVKQM